MDFEIRITVLLKEREINLIQGLSFSREVIHAKEKKCLSEFYASDNPYLGDAIVYYQFLFLDYLNQHSDSGFSRKNSKEQKRILDKEIKEYQEAMRYAFNKGHQTAFNVLLKDTKNNQGYEKEYFKNPSSLNNFLYTFEETITKDTFRENIMRDSIDVLTNFTRRNFNKTYDVIKALGMIFFKKGAGIAFEQIRKQIVGSDYEITGYSKLMHVPINQEFDVTPAFKGQFSLESPDNEEWDIFWDATYDAAYADSLIAKCVIHKISMSDARKMKEKDAITYRTILDTEKTVNSLEDSDSFYLVEISFLLFNPNITPRLLSYVEYKAIVTSLTSTISRKLRVSADHIYVTKS